MKNPFNHTRFTNLLSEWNKEQNRREMPWKGETDPYRIWLSEVILQQTRVQQGTAYYHKFLRLFPTVQQLAQSRDEEVFKAWEGLGYYSRCRNLIATARFVAKELNGIFPRTYTELLNLKGIGPYTAAAIASFAYGAGKAVVDGNVYRVLARYFGVRQGFSGSAGKKLFDSLAHDVLDRNDPASHNQAIMDFGATVCKPKNPSCSICILNHECFAFRQGQQEELPVKKPTRTIRNRWFYYFLHETENEILIMKRTGDDIWSHLHEFVLIENDEENEDDALIRSYGVIAGINSNDFFFTSPLYSQRLTHQLIRGKFFRIRHNERFNIDQGAWFRKNEIEGLAFPSFINKFLREHPLI